jgi:hypothetical protein
VVINVEAPRAYPRLSASSPKCCVLRTGGRILCGDFRGRSECPCWDAALADIQVRQVSERVTNPEVLRGMERNSQRSMHPIGRLMPAFMRPFGRRFAGVPGTGNYRDIANGKIEGTGCIASPRSERRRQAIA